MSEFALDILAADCGALRSDLMTSRQVTAQGRRVLVRNPDTGKTFLFSEGAFRVLECLQTGRPARLCIRAAFGEALEHSPSTAQLIAHARTAELLTGSLTPAANPKPLRLANHAAHWNPLYIRIPLADPQPLVRWLRPIAALLFHRWMFTLWAFASLIVAAVSVFSWTRYGWEMVIFRQFAWWPLLYAALAASAVIHELAHVMACDRYGVAVRQVGILFYFLNPGAYADVSGAWMLPQRRKRVAIALAGVYVESIVWTLLSAFWLLTVSGPLHEIAFVLALCLSTRIVVNLIPFLRLDGYWALADLIGIPNLRSSSFAYLLARLPALRGRKKGHPKVTRKQAAILAVYGSAATVFLVGAFLLMLWNLFQMVAKMWPSQAAAGFWLSRSVVVLVVVLAALNLAARAGVWPRRNNPPLDT